MKIIAKTNFAGLKFNAIVGQELDLPDNVAQDLIRAKLAEAKNIKGKKAEVDNENKRDNAGIDTEPTSGKRTGSKRNRA